MSKQWSIMAFKPDYMNKRIPGSNEAMHLNYIQQVFKDEVSKGGLVNLSHYFQFSMLSESGEWLDSDGGVVTPDSYEFYIAADLTLSDKEVQDYLRSKNPSFIYPEPATGKKFDQGKLQWRLLPWRSLKEVVEILTFGATKYSREEILWEKITMEMMENCCDVPIAIKEIKYTSCQQKNVSLAPKKGQEIIQKYVTTATKGGVSILNLQESVAAVTIKDLKESILSIDKDSGRITLNGNKLIKTGLSNTEVNGIVVQNSKKEITSQSGIKNSPITDSLNKTTITSLNVDVSYVEEQTENRTSTIATKQGSLEVFFVASATTVWECLEMTYKDLSELSITFKGLLTKTISGQNNWMFVDNAKERYSDAALRHFTSWLSGERCDEETGKSHLAHCVCCLLFLMWFDKEE